MTVMTPQSDIVLGVGVPLSRKLEIPLCCFRIGPLHAMTDDWHPGKVELCSFISTLSCQTKFSCPEKALDDTKALAVHDPDAELLNWLLAYP